MPQSQTPTFQKPSAGNWQWVPTDTPDGGHWFNVSTMNNAQGPNYAGPTGPDFNPGSGLGSPHQGLGNGFPSGPPQTSFAGGVGDAVQGAGKWVMDNGGKWVLDHTDELLAAGSAISGYFGGREADKLTDRGLASAEGAYNERAGLRKMGVEGMMNNTRPDLSSIFSNPGDVYAAKPAAGAGAGLVPLPQLGPSVVETQPPNLPNGTPFIPRRDPAKGLKRLPTGGY